MNYIGRQTTIEVGGKPYTLSRFTRRVELAFADWANAKRPHPLQDIDPIVGRYGRQIQAALVADALVRLAHWERDQSITSQANQDLLSNEVGQLKLLALLLEESHPELTQDEVARLYVDCLDEHGEGYLADAIVRCAGRMPIDKAEALTDYLVEYDGFPPRGMTDVDEANRWVEIDKALMRHYKMTPLELELLTTTETAVMLAALRDSSQTAELGTPDSNRHIKQARAYAALEPLQKLEVARRQYGL